MASVAVPIVLAALLVVLAAHFVAVLHFWLVSLRYPFGLDYGEGIVWQQALLIPSARMYGDITHFPYIVFHYPPIYHLTVRAIAGLGVDWLIAGRGVSMAAALTTGALAAALTYRAVRGGAGRAASVVGASVAGLVTFTCVPVVVCAALMRVDMLAVAFSFLGVYCAVGSLERPRLLYCAMALFVLAIYTKQTEIAAPFATVIVLLLIEPRRTLKAIGFGAMLAVTALVLLEARTGGGFLRHILLYNINRYSFPVAVLRVVHEGATHALYLLLAVGAAVGIGRTVMRRGVPALREASGCIPAIFTLYLAITTAMLVTAGKSGATINYFIEWMCVWSVLIGVLVAPIVAGAAERPMPALGVAAALLLQVVLLPVWPSASWAGPGRVAELRALADRVRAAPAQVISDDMVLLMRAGKPVPWEPAIFAELAATGAWDAGPLVGMIERHDFAFIVTTGQPGDAIYDSRYSPEVSGAIDAAYPRMERHGRLVVHLPPA